MFYDALLEDTGSPLYVAYCALLLPTNQFSFLFSRPNNIVIIETLLYRKEFHVICYRLIKRDIFQPFVVETFWV